MRDRVRVVVQGDGRRRPGAGGLARLLWVSAEVVTTVGVVVALLVVHQVWWTNRQAAAAAQEQVRALEEEWSRFGEGDPPGDGGSLGDEGSLGGGVEVPDPAGDAGETPSGTDSGVVGGGGPAAPPPVTPPAPRRAVPAPDRAYAVLRIPRLGLAVPVAQGVDKRAVLDKGYAGHYPGTARPGERGNFALAGHRNTHGEPFRYINRLVAGDELLVDVRGTRYTYVVGKVLKQTTARDTGVIAPVPRSVVKPAYGYTEPGAYITLTTCTPEYTSTYRLVVWGALTSSPSRVG